MATKKRPSRSAKSTEPNRKSKTPRTGPRVTKPKVRSVAVQAPEAAPLQAGLRESIERDIAARIEAHQREMVRIRASVRRGERQPPLMLLAHGDSWFDYPCHGNTYTPLSPTDIIVHLRKVGNPTPKILNDATTDEMGLQKQCLALLAARLTRQARGLTGLCALAYAWQGDSLLRAEPGDRGARDSCTRPGPRVRGTRPPPFHQGRHPR
jgi:Protein of unknown function (DUF2462)